jgi:hypothetical protein
MKAHERPISVAKKAKRFVLISILTVMAALGAIYAKIELDPKMKKGLYMAYEEKFNQRRLLLASSKLAESDNGTLLFLGDLDSVPRGGGRYYLGQYDEEAGIVKRVDLDQDEARQLADRWRRLNFGREWAKRKHVPEIGLTLRQGKKVVFEGSVDVHGGSFWYRGLHDEWEKENFNTKDEECLEFIRYITQFADGV